MEGDPVFLKPTPITNKNTEFKFDHLKDEDDFEDEVFTHKNSIAFFKDIYQIIGLLRYCSYGVIVAGIEKATQRPCAIKIIKKYNLSSEEIQALRNEAIILAPLKHKNIVEYYNIHESERILIIVKELIKGISLLQYIKGKLNNNECISPNVISNIMKQILEALQYIHSKNLIHNDLKPENIMLIKCHNFQIIKITDFAISSKLENTKWFFQGNINGTIAYMSPELIKTKLTTKYVDIWACGVLFYIMFTFKHPFYSPNDSMENVYNNILKGPDFPNKLPKIAKDFFSKLCSFELERRLDATSALKHPFITGRKSNSEPLTLFDEILYLENDSKVRQVLMITLWLGFVLIQNKKTLKPEKPLKIPNFFNIELDEMNYTFSRNSTNIIDHNNSLPPIENRKNSLNFTKDSLLDNESESFNLIIKGGNKCNVNLNNTPKFVKKHSVFGKEVNFKYQKSTFANINSQKNDKTSKIKTQKISSCPIKINPIKAVPINKIEIQKLNSNKNQLLQDYLKKTGDKVVEKLLILLDKEKNESLNIKKNSKTIKKVQSYKNNILIRCPKFQKYCQMNISPNIKPLQPKQF